MADLSMKRWAKRCGMTRQEDTWYGKVEEYLVTLVIGTRHILAAVAVPLTDKAQAALTSLLETDDSVSRAQLRDYSVTPVGIRLLFAKRRSGDARIQICLSRVLSCLRQHGCECADYCACCHQPVLDLSTSPLELDGVRFPCHQRCRSEWELQEAGRLSVPRLNEPPYARTFLRYGLFAFLSLLALCLIVFVVDRILFADTPTSRSQSPFFYPTWFFVWITLDLFRTTWREDFRPRLYLCRAGGLLSGAVGGGLILIAVWAVVFVATSASLGIGDLPRVVAVPFLYTDLARYLLICFALYAGVLALSLLFLFVHWKWKRYMAT